jgi:hypothetical protein
MWNDAAAGRGASSVQPEIRMVTREDVESFLLRMEEQMEEIEPGMWVIGADSARVVIHHSPPLLILRSKVMELPEDPGQCAKLYRKLLELNAGDLVHGAYAIEGNDVILTDTLQLENLEFSSLQASVDSIEVALAEHLDALSPYRAEC